MYDTSAIPRIALAAARPWAYALGGAGALALHAVADRPATDVELFSPDEGGVRPAAAAVARALTDAGFETTEVEVESDLAGLIEGLDTAMAELEVLRPDGGVCPLSLGVQPRIREPIERAVGLVLHLDDLAASKVSAMANGAEVRDFIDVAALRSRFSRAELLALAAEVDPGLTAEDYAAAMRQLDVYPRLLFTRAGADAAAVRAAFADWPR